MERVNSPLLEKYLEIVPPLRLLFKERFNLPITDPRYTAATGEDVLLDHIMRKMWEAFVEKQNYESEGIEEDERILLEKLEKGEISWDEFAEEEMKDLINDEDEDEEVE